MEDKRDFLIKPYKILIVDDDPFVIKTLERILFKKNFLFHSATSGEKALQAIHDFIPDLVLLDILMYDIDGYEVCKKLKKLPGYEHIPVIFLTSNTALDEIVKGFDAGAVDYIVKPFNTPELIARLETHLELKRSREEFKQMDLLKTKFFSIMTHDIKNSIIGLRGVANFLMQELTEIDPENNEALKLSKILLNDSNELYELLEVLIEWASIELGEKKIDIQKIKPKEFLKSIINSYKQTIEQKQLKVSLVCDQSPNPFLPIGHLESIMHGMISNAVKYSNKGGNISIEYSHDGNQNIFSVTDEGVGITDEVAANIFRLDTPHQKSKGGFSEKNTRVGLILCKALTDHIKGAISMVTSKGKGNKIICRLPDFQKNTHI